ncbi:tRNA-uridine aminocarboxypropyltransferase A-like [Rhododendron vialii]|uniref:tRNA-uridine aminocarboxypropyltransferase A-like n=1 Tax=Rhododendron vialii TaxID=182163 RepID=UPI00265F0C06|nr:tRNA-uridine aminocarboxypropyltransferase A-like [Rhododendron vialii]
MYILRSRRAFPESVERVKSTVSAGVGSGYEEGSLVVGGAHPRGQPALGDVTPATWRYKRDKCWDFTGHPILGLTKAQLPTRDLQTKWKDYYIAIPVKVIWHPTKTPLFHTSDPPTTAERRRICTGGCDRPTNVCLCEKIPTEPISTLTQVAILHHPHEQRHKLATVPVLTKCLRCCQALVGRRLNLGDSPLLDSLYNAAVENPSRPFHGRDLFPSTDSSPAIDISKCQSSLRGSYISKYVLIAFDGTWKHSKEMVQASLPFLSKFAIRVSLDYVGIEGGTIFDSELILRKEPFSGCMSTMEAIARALCVLDPHGVEIEGRLVEVLRAMVRFQACYLMPMKPRPKLPKRGKEDEKNNQSAVVFGL